MTIVGDRHYRGNPGEQITFSTSDANQIGAITVTGAGPALPCAVGCGQQTRVAISVGFTGNSGGSVNVTVTGSDGGEDTQPIRQIAGLGARNVVFIVE